MNLEIYDSLASEAHADVHIDTCYYNEVPAFRDKLTGEDGHRSSNQKIFSQSPSVSVTIQGNTPRFLSI